MHVRKLQNGMYSKLVLACQTNCTLAVVTKEAFLILEIFISVYLLDFLKKLFVEFSYNSQASSTRVGHFR